MKAGIGDTVPFRALLRCRMIIGPDGGEVVEEWYEDCVDVMEYHVDENGSPYFLHTSIPVTEFADWQTKELAKYK